MRSPFAALAHFLPAGTKARREERRLSARLAVNVFISTKFRLCNARAVAAEPQSKKVEKARAAVRSWDSWLEREGRLMTLSHY